MISIRRFTAADIPLGMRLKCQAGWNQVDADWRRMLDLQPDGCFVAEHGGVAAGTVMTCIFGEVAWIAMMLVEESLRGKGIGRALMEHVLQYLDERQVHTVRLDATPLGQPLYEKLGFVAQYSLARFAGISSGGESSADLAAAAGDDYEAIFALDRLVTQTDRRKLLARLLAERGAKIAVEQGEIRGYVASRPGSNATQIGPCIADQFAGPALLAHALAEHRGSPVYLDVPMGHEPAAALARQHGLAIQRNLLRMCRGPLIHERVEQLWVSSGPELG